jgi:sec-independent protein translocase protein TatC
VSLHFLFGFQEDFLALTIGADEYLSFVVRLLVGFGLIFELPVVVLILSALGLVTPRFLRSKRRHAVVLITVAASFLSPGDVIMVTILMMVPLILLYEFSILLSVLVTRGRERDEERTIHAPGAEPPDGAVEAR